HRTPFTHLARGACRAARTDAARTDAARTPDGVGLRAGAARRVERLPDSDELRLRRPVGGRAAPH
ncbi:hypothetical protein, partial [Streptomyces bohaiensis]|uniref:hypothetical protein n=1 Tax=Streptomyces bohaiensis TaxID=1431344 RepID=UPI0030C710D5